MTSFGFRTKDGSATVEVDGKDVSNHVASVALFADARTPLPVVTLGLTIRQFTNVSVDPARVELAPEQRDLLVSLGWTPPEGDER